jgi:predicted regulator of Ras-like GTPase activity (Roadblock/LC7/MglB family)
MIKKIQGLIEQMSKELPGVLAAAVVTIEDGMSIAEASNKGGIETAAASAYLASIVKSNAKAIRLLADDEEIDDILVTTNKYHFIIRHQPEQPFFIFLMTTEETWLGKARMLIKNYEEQFEQFSDFLEQHYQV